MISAARSSGPWGRQMPSQTFQLTDILLTAARAYRIAPQMLLVFLAQMPQIINKPSSVMRREQRGEEEGNKDKVRLLVPGSGWPAMPILEIRPMGKDTMVR